MDVAMMQPSFMPWQGYFELILKSDIFIVLDDFQFSVQSYHQRNRLFVNRGQVDWYTVPIQKNVCFKAPLNQVLTNERTNWRIKMWKRIQNNYTKAPYYKELAPWLEQWIMDPAENLAAQNTAFIIFVCTLLEYKGKFHFSSELNSDKTRSARVVELLRWCNARRYFCARGSFGYMSEDGIFPLDDVTVCFQDFRPAPYPQIGADQEFAPNLSVLDALMNIGPDRTAEYIRGGTLKWLNWEEMKIAQSCLI